MREQKNFTGVASTVAARGVAFIKSRKAIDNVMTILDDMVNMASTNSHAEEFGC